jgi:glycosyltransferase involved in cell wall biosynthesis
MIEPPSLEAYHKWRQAADRGRARVRNEVEDQHGAPTRKPSVSIVTAVRNAAGSLERAMQSVLAQSHPRIEYIVIDGGSADGTLDVVRRHADRLAFWISEPDRGISDAFNKGVAAAGGEFIGLLNADDWMEPDQIEWAVAALERTGADFVFGDLVYHDPAGRAVHRVVGDPRYAKVIGSRMPEVNHPTLLARRAMYERIGLFDLRYRAAMDYDWLLRAHLAGGRGAHDPGIVAHMTLAGVSDRAYGSALAEVRAIAIRHGQPAIKAWPLYGYRVAKGAAQRALRCLAPEPLYAVARRLVNRSYRPYRPRAGE